MKHALLLPIMLTLSLACEAAVYQWTDANGRVHFSDRPEADDSKAVQVKPSPPASSSTPNTLERDQKRQRLLEVYEEDRERKRVKAEKQKRESEEKKRKCLQLRNRLEKYRHAGGIYEKNAQGERQYLSHEQRERYITDLEVQVERWCGK